MPSTSSALSRRSLLLGAAAVPVSAAVGLSGCTSPARPGSGSSGSGALSLLLLGPSQELVAHMTDRVLPAFTSASGRTVDLQTSDWGSAFQKVTTQAASNSLADVLVIGGIWTAPLAAKNVLLDLTDRFSAWAEGSQFYPSLLTDGTWQDRLFAIPFGGDVRTGVYRTDLLEAAGVSALPTSWPEFRAAAERVKAAGTAAPIDWNINKSIGLQQSFAQLFLQAGGQYWDAQGRAGFASAAGRRALEFLVGTYTDGLADVNMVNSGSTASALVQGSAAMTFSGVSSEFNALQFDAPVADRLAAGPGLKPDAGGTARSVAWINKFAIAARTKDPDGAWSLVTHLLSGDMLGDVARLSSVLPPRRDLAEAEWIGPIGRQIMPTLETAVSQPPSPKMLQLGPAVTTLLEPAIRGTVGVDATLEAIDQKIDSIRD